MITDLKGSCEIDSEIGLGTKFSIRLPLSLSLFNGTILSSRRHEFIINNSEIDEVVNLNSQRIDRVSKTSSSLSIHDCLVPLISISKTLNLEPRAPSDDLSRGKELVAVLTSVNSKKYALIFDQVLESEHILLKPLDKVLQHNPLFAGGAITKDGQLKYVLNLNKVVEKFQESA